MLLAYSMASSEAPLEMGHQEMVGITSPFGLSIPQQGIVEDTRLGSGASRGSGSLTLTGHRNK